MKATLYGYSDDCANVSVGKEHPFDGEYSDKRVVLTSPEGLEVVVELKFEGGWGVVIEFPEGFQAEAQERHIPDGPWTK